MKQTASTKIQSKTQYHNSALVKNCATKLQYHTRFYNTEHEPICPYKSNDVKLIAELGRVLIHKIAPDKKGVLLDSYDTNGKAKAQYMIKEETVIPIDMKNIKENEKMTECVQEPQKATIIRENYTLMSTIFFKDTSQLNMYSFGAGTKSFKSFQYKISSNVILLTSSFCKHIQITISIILNIN